MNYKPTTNAKIVVSQHFHVVDVFSSRLLNAYDFYKLNSILYLRICSHGILLRNLHRFSQYHQHRIFFSMLTYNYSNKSDFLPACS